MPSSSSFPIMTAEEAAELIDDGAMVAVGGFTPAGAPKAIPRALARRAKRIHEAGRPFQIRLISGASTGAACDDELGNAEALSWRAPYITSKPLRDLANSGKLDFLDMHLSHVAQVVLEGFLGPIDVAVVEATEVTPDGKVYLTPGIGNAPSFLKHARGVLIEINSYHSPRLRESTDILVLSNPPAREPIPIRHPLDKIGLPYAQVDPKKILGIVHNHEPDCGRPFAPPDSISRRIAAHVARFFLDEIASGRIPREFLPLQSGVGNVANAVLRELGAHDDFPPFWIFTEVFQDAMLDLLRSGKILGASTSALTLSDKHLTELYADYDRLGPKIVLRPQDLSNNPGVIRQLGVVAINTALEIDIYGHVNSTHINGTQLMNGIGGSGDFERNAYLSVFVCPSIVKDGRISTIVPFCSHVDHTEHSVQIVATEHGLADLRGLAPVPRARRIIERCAHPAYRELLHRYIDNSPPGHIRHDLGSAFEWQRNYLEHGAMLLDFDPEAFEAESSEQGD